MHRCTGSASGVARHCLVQDTIVLCMLTVVGGDGGRETVTGVGE